MKQVFYFLIAIVVITACGSDENALKRYTDGVIVINEGNFTDGDASISFINPESNKVATGLFYTANQGLSLGDVANDAWLEGNHLFVVVNNSNKVEVLNSETFERQFVIEGISQPRTLKVYNNKGYVTEWGVYPAPAKVSEIDLETGAVTGTFTPGSGAEDLIFVQNNMYVSNQFEQSVSVIDLNDLNETITISTGNSPDDMVLDANGKIWLICSGGYDFETYAPLNDGQLVRINPVNNTIEATIELNANVTGRLALDAEANHLFYLKGNAVYTLSVGSNAAPAEPFVVIENAVSLYGIGVNPENGEVYVLDSNGFQTNGKAYRFSATGTYLNTYTVGRGPNKVLFN